MSFHNVCLKGCFQSPERFSDSESSSFSKLPDTWHHVFDTRLLLSFSLVAEENLQLGFFLTVEMLKKV